MMRLGMNEYLMSGFEGFTQKLRHWLLGSYIHLMFFTFIFGMLTHKLACLGLFFPSMLLYFVV